MAWSPKTKPTPANVRKRIQAAIDALEGALVLIDQRPPTTPNIRLRARVNNAILWADDARKKTKAR